jgi:hypothetical protein
LLAGVLRVAVAAQRSGVTSGAAIAIESLPQGLLLQVRGVEETPEIAARFTEAKYPLERALGKTLLVRPAVQTEIQPAHPLAERVKKTSPPPVSIIH